jgi:hypothetical protein
VPSPFPFSLADQPPPDSEVLQATINAIRKFKQSLTLEQKGWALLETAGGNLRARCIAAYDLLGYWMVIHFCC